MGTQACSRTTSALLSHALAPRSYREVAFSSAISAGCAKRLVKVGNDIIAVFNANAEANHFWPYACLALFFGGHLPMCRGSGVACQRLGVANIDQPREKFERVVESLTGLEPADDPESQQRTAATSKIFLRERVVRAVRKTSVSDPLDSWVLAQKFGDPLTVFDMALDT